MDEDSFGSGAAFTPHVSLVPSTSSPLDKDPGSCDQVSPRTVAQGLKTFFDRPNTVVQDNFFVPSLFTLIWFQYVIHDCMNIKFHGNDQGAYGGPTGVSTDMTSKVPACISTHYNAPIPVPCDDPFYSSKNITAIPFVRAALTQESCNIEPARPVSL